MSENNPEKPYMLTGYISNVPDTYENIQNDYNSGNISADEMIQRARNVDYNIQQQANNELWNQYFKNAVAGLGAIGSIPLGPVAGGALSSGTMSYARGDDLPNIMANTVLGAAGGKAADAVLRPIFNVAPQVVNNVAPYIKNFMSRLNNNKPVNFGAGNINNINSPIKTSNAYRDKIESKSEPQTKYFVESPTWTNDTTFNPNYEMGTIYTHGSPNIINEGSNIWAQNLKNKPRTTDRGMWGDAAYMSPMSTEKNALVSNSYARGNGGNYLVNSVNDEYLLKADVPIIDNSNNVKAAYRNFYKNLGYSDSDINTMMLSDAGQDFYDRVAQYAVNNNLDANLLLNANGVAGVIGKYFTGGQQAAIFNELNNSVIGKKLSDSMYWNLIDKLGY